MHLATTSKGFFPPPLPTTTSSISHRQNFEKIKLFKAHHQVSYYDKLLDACESAAEKRGRTALVREVQASVMRLILIKPPLQNHFELVL